MRGIMINSKGRDIDNMDQNVHAVRRAQAEACMIRLEANQFETQYFDNSSDALSFLKKTIPADSTVGVGGSETLRQIHAIEWLENEPSLKFLDRYHAGNEEQVLRDSLTADVFLTSSNAVTMNGMLYNVDGRGNRIAALTFGPKKVYVLVGTNKIVSDIDAAVQRVKTIAAPANCMRLKRQTPCTKTGECMECSYDQTICSSYAVTRRSHIKNRICVIFINEELGF